MENGSVDGDRAGLEPQPRSSRPMGTDELASSVSARGVALTSGDSSRQSTARRRGKCRYYGTKKGCRAGASCPYSHVNAAVNQGVALSNQPTPSQTSAASNHDLDHSVIMGVQNPRTRESRPESAPQALHAMQPQRPVCKAEQKDPREFQINQLRRRFRPGEESDANGSTLIFELTPSDPDFPFELDKLQCVLRVPTSYPGEGRPTLTVTNPEMEPAFQANVARGFDDIVDYTLRMNRQGTLLGWLNSLDKQLERLLTTLERGPKLKFVANLGDSTTTRRPTPTQASGSTPVVSSQTPVPAPDAVVSATPFKAPIVAQNYTAQQKIQAEKRRNTETKQLEARLGRLSLFQKRNDSTFVIPIQPNKPDRLPHSLKSVKTVKLHVPELYPLEHSSIEIQEVDEPEARSVEIGFAQWVKQTSQLNLVSQINYLTSNIHNFAKTPLPEVAEHSQPEHIPQTAEKSIPPQEDADRQAQDEDRPHLHVIPRPPEWSVAENDVGSGITDESSYDGESGENDEDGEEGGAPVPAPAINTPGNGVALSFPFLELYGIELLDLVHLAITVKCERCKESTDIKNVPQLTDPKDTPKSESCKKCTNSMSIGFRRQLMHSHANRAGYLDIYGCTVVDLLPSNFIPTCSECSTAYHAPGVSAVRGESAMAICRHCHRKMVFKMPEVKFLVVGSAAVSSRAGLPLKRRPKEVLGIVAGQELPRRGRCQHYAKSYRWFRFSCCAKVFPCDKCHDAESDHPNEHANRMICGFCSREQIYRPENCGICRAVLIGKAGSGFWEGGKGTRNRVLMSRKDPRKYKRQGGIVTGGSSSKRK